MKKNIKKYALIGVLALGLIFAFPKVWIQNLFSKSGDQNIEKNEAIIDSLTTVIEANKLRELQRDEQLKEIKDSIVELNYLFKREQYKSKELKNKLDEKLNNVNNYTSSDITKFWTNRYTDSTITK